jgi:hypothetical protein
MAQQQHRLDLRAGTGRSFVPYYASLERGTHCYCSLPQRTEKT